MKKSWRFLLVILTTLILVVLVGPFLIPVAPLTDTIPPEQLADSDSQFIEHLCAILSDSNLRVALSQGALAWAADFDWDDSARLMLTSLCAMVH